MSDKKMDTLIAKSGTIIRAENGDILRYDSTGLVMVLSDQVIEDVARRLPQAIKKNVSSTWIDPTVLGDIDAWDVRQDGEWYVFNANLPGAQGPRQFRRLASAENSDSDPSIFADGAGPLCGVFSLGGPRRATGYDAAGSYPWHVLSPADDLGAVGHSGTGEALVQSTLEPLREMTRDAALADTLVTRQHENHKALSLFVARCETDSSCSVNALRQGRAYANLLASIKSLTAAANRLERTASLYAIGLDFTLEDIESNAETYRNDFLDLLSDLTADIAKLGLRRPPFLSIFDCGTHLVNDHPVLRAQWELAWQGTDYGLCYTAPGYMFRQDSFGRADLSAVWQMAEMETYALQALHAGETWFCPIFLLAEREPDPKQIRVRARAMSDLQIDTKDPFGAGSCCGFSLAGVSNAAKLTGVSVAEDDAQDVILTFNKAPKGKQLEVRYAFGMAPDRKGVDFPQACGAIRDSWHQKSKSGASLNRWALPAVLPVW